MLLSHNQNFSTFTFYIIQNNTHTHTKNKTFNFYVMYVGGYGYGLYHNLMWNKFTKFNSYNFIQILTQICSLE